MGRLLITLRGEDDELAFVRGTLLVGRRHLSLVRTHVGEDALVARGGACFAIAHLTALAEADERLRLDLRDVAELAAPVPLPAGIAEPLDEVDVPALDALHRPPSSGFAEDLRMPFGPLPRTDDEIAVIAAYDLCCAISRYRAPSPEAAMRRLVVLPLALAEEGRLPVNAAIPVDAALEYALAAGHIEIADDYRIVVARPLPVEPLHPLRDRLALPADPAKWPSPAALAAWRRRPR